MVDKQGIAASVATAVLAVGSAALAQPLPTMNDGTERPVMPIVVEAPLPNGQAVLPVLTIDQDMLYARSQWGQRVQEEIEQRRREIAAENDRLAEQFASEEQELTALRRTLPPDEFRKRADEFDKRVVEVRRERDTEVRALQIEAEEERRAFLDTALPILASLMRERGAVVVLEHRAIFVASQSIDVTDDLIARIDREIGAGPVQPDAEEKPDAAPAASTTNAQPDQPTEPAAEQSGQ